MSSPPTAVLADPSNQASEPEKSSNRRRWFEIALIIFMALSGPLVRAVVQFRSGPTASGQFDNSRWLSITFHEVGILLLLGYILWRGGRTFRDIGFQWSWRDAAVGLLLFVVSYLAYVMGATVLHIASHLVFGGSTPQIDARQIFGHMPWLALPFTLLNPFFEELVVRAYVMTELRELTGSVWSAAIVSLVLQTSYHIYYGWLGAVSVGIMFFVFVTYFAIWRKALPLVVAHGIVDLIGFIRLH